MAVVGDDAEAGILATDQRARDWPARWQVSPLVAGLAVVLLILIVPPTLYLVATSLYTTKPNGAFDQLTLRYYRELFTSPFFASSLLNTVIYAVGSAVVAIILGVTQALIVERTNTPGRRYVFLVAVISLGIPHVLYTVSWLLLLGRTGPVNAMIGSIFGVTGEPVLNVYSLWGMILVEGVGFAPLTFLLMSAVLRSTDASFEEAALMAGAGPLKTFRSITLRLGLPGVLALMLLIGIRAFESFEVPALVGLAGNVTVLTTNIYQSSKTTGLTDYGQSGAYAVSLLLIVGVLLLWHNRLAHNAHQFQTITGKGYRPRVIDLGLCRYATATLLLVIFILVIVFPLGILIFTSLMPFYEGLTWGSFGRFTFENYSVLFGPGSFRESIVNTLVLGIVTASAVVPMTALCAWLTVRRHPGAWFLDQLTTAPLVFPAIVMSVAFLHVFVNLPVPLYGTLLSVIIASAVRYLPYGMRYAYAGVLQIHMDLEDAATTAGAGRARTFLRVVIPLIGPALVSCWLFVFLLTVQSVALPLLLVGPGTELIAVNLFDLWQNGQITELAAMGVLWMSVMVVVSACFFLMTRKYQLSA
jgi:iron(III) transport system permease protein